MMWNARIRFMSSCAIAPSTPIVIVRTAITISTVPIQSGGSNRSVWVRMIAYTPTFVSRPAKIAVTGPGAVG